MVCNPIVCHAFHRALGSCRFRSFVLSPVPCCAANLQSRHQLAEAAVFCQASNVEAFSVYLAMEFPVAVPCRHVSRANVALDMPPYIRHVAATLGLACEVNATQSPHHLRHGYLVGRQDGGYRPHALPP